MLMSMRMGLDSVKRPRTVEPELSSGNSVSRGWKEVVEAWTLLSERRGKRRVTVHGARL